MKYGINFTADNGPDNGYGISMEIFVVGIFCSLFNDQGLYR